MMANKIYGLFNTKGKIVKVSLKLDEVVSHLDRDFPAKVWNSLFSEDDPEVCKKILTENGFEIRTTSFENEKPCCEHPGREKCDQCQETGSANPANH